MVLDEDGNRQRQWWISPLMPGRRRWQGGEEKGREKVAAEELDALPRGRNDGDEFARLGYGAPKAAGGQTL